MKLDFTSIARPLFARRIRQVERTYADTEALQRRVLRGLLANGCRTAYGREHRFGAITTYSQWQESVPITTYADLRPWVMRMINGEPDVLWPGKCTRFAQSSGTSDGKSKYIPVTNTSLKLNHYRGGFDTVAHYLNLYPESHLFGGKALILGGSFANELSGIPKGVKVGDLSAHLIDNINPLAGLFRTPNHDIAVMPDWETKLPALVEATIHQPITNLSGVPSWMLTVLKKVLERTGADSIHDVWPQLEVFFHGGISFEPYREQYQHITRNSRMRFMETYNASEGFFAVQSASDDHSMLMLVDSGVMFEFLPISELSSPTPKAIPAWEVTPGHTYALIISSTNGLWRYSLGDTVTIASVNPLKIVIAGRTRHFINAFGEEVMVYNTDRALTKTCALHHAEAINYTAAPVYAGDRSRGRHQWLIEFSTPPADIKAFARDLDLALQQENSDYQAKRAKGIFLDPAEVVVAKPGVFDHWLANTGKMGGQRKVPRLSNERIIIDQMLEINNHLTFTT